MTETESQQSLDPVFALRRARFLLFITEEFQVFQQDKAKIKDFESQYKSAQEQLNQMKNDRLL